MLHYGRNKERLGGRLWAKDIDRRGLEKKSKKS